MANERIAYDEPFCDDLIYLDHIELTDEQKKWLEEFKKENEILLHSNLIYGKIYFVT